MRVLVTGGRDYGNFKAVYEALDAEKIDLLIHGAATGADSIADQWARSRGVYVATFPVYPETWTKQGRSAGPIRNKLMLLLSPSLVMAFPGGRGTANMVALADRAGIKVKTYDS